MTRKDLAESKHGLLSWTQQNTATSLRQGSRKPPLPSKCYSAAPSKTASLKKIGELKKVHSKSLNLPTLNLEKVRRNFLDQAELASNGGASLGAEPPTVHSARLATERSRIERRILFSGSLTDRSSREVTVERKVANSASLTADRSCRQSIDRKSAASGLLTDRSCRESFGSTYGLRLSRHSRSSRESPVRSSKDSSLPTPTMPKLKADCLVDRANANCAHSDHKKNRDKVAKYHSSISLATYLPSTNSSQTSSFCSRIHKTSRHSGLTSRIFLNSRDSSDSKGGGSDSRSFRSGNGLDSTRTSISKTESGSWDTKRLLLHLVNTIEDPDTAVKRAEFPTEAGKGAVHKESRKDLDARMAFGKICCSQGAKSFTHLDRMKVQEARLSQEDLSADELAPTSRRACPKAMENGRGEPVDCNKEGINKLPAKTVRVRPLKLSLETSRIAVPLGFGGNPTDNVQTSRAFQSLGAESNLQLAYTDRGVSRRAFFANPISRHEWP